MAPLRRLAQVSSHLATKATAASAAHSTSSGTAPTTATYLTRNLTSSSSTPTPPSTITKKDRAFYPYSLDIQSRWADNDQYGHLNNAHYYALFDTVINTFLIQETGLDPSLNGQQTNNAIGVVAESGCQYFSSLSFPDLIEARLAVIKLGKSSVVYQVGIFKKLSLSSSLSSSLVTPSSKGTGMFLKAPWTHAVATTTAGDGWVAGDAAASGHFCHVFVDKVSRRPVPIPARIRSGLELLQTTAALSP